MGAVWFLARANLRRRWVGAAVLIVLVGVAGGAVVGSVAGARRTATSLDRFEAASRAANLEINVGEATSEQLARFRDVDGIAALGVLQPLALFNLDLGFLPTAGPVDDLFGATIDRMRVVRGRLARGPHELNIGEGLAARMSFAVGDRVTFVSFTPDEIRTQLGTETFDPHGPSPTFRIVGIVRHPLDLGARGATGGVIVPTRAFMERYEGQIGSFGFVLRVRTESDADTPRVAAAARRIFGESEDFGFLGMGIEGPGARSAIDVSTGALWILAGVAALVGVVAVGLAMARRISDESGGADVLRALGLGRRQRWGVSITESVPIALVGAAACVVVAWFLSPLFPIGVARDAEPGLGLRFDALAFGLGSVGVFIAVMVIGAVAGLLATARPAKAPSRPSAASRAVADAGLAPPATVGIGFVFGRTGERRAPVWSAIGAMTLGVVGVVAALVFTASLDRLVSTPSAYGWTWDVVLDGYGGSVPCPRSDPLGSDHAVRAAASYCYMDLSVAGQPAVGSAFRSLRGRIEPEIVSGRAPRTPREVTIGRDLLHATGRSIGDTVSAGSNGARAKYEIVGTTVIAGVGDAQPLAGGALFTPDGLARAGEVEDNYFLAKLRPEIDDRSELRRLKTEYANVNPILASVPAEIERIRQIDALPGLLAALTVMIALVSVTYTLVVSIRRRHRDLAVLRTMGFTKRQVRAAIAWQASTLGAIGLVAGLILGLVIGHEVWHAVADDLGVAPTWRVSVVGLALLVPAALLFVNVIAALPARSAANTPPAVVLRSE